MAACSEACSEKQRNAPGSTISPTTYTKSGVEGLCCNCRMERPWPPPPPPPGVAGASSRVSSGMDGAHLFLATTTRNAGRLTARLQGKIDDGTLISALQASE